MSKRKKPLNRISGDLRKVGRPPEGQPFIWHTRELLASPAWRAMPINCRRLIEFLEIDHMAHAGAENGRLLATYGQLEAWGITRHNISKTIRQAEQLGVIEVTRGGRASYAKSNPTKFRLTYLPDKQVNEWGVVYYGTPTNEWRRITAARAEQITGLKIAEAKTFVRPRSDTTIGPEVTPIGPLIGPEVTPITPV